MIQVTTNVRRTSGTVTGTRPGTSSDAREESDQHWSSWFNAKSVLAVFLLLGGSANLGMSLGITLLMSFSTLFVLECAVSVIRLVIYGFSGEYACSLSLCS